MASKQIKQEIVLAGEKQYNAALKEARSHLKTLQSALKAETAELGANATAQQKNEVRAKSLKQQIAEQEKVVNTLKAALEEVKEKYGDNTAEVEKWEQKLNGARTTLANMRNDLDSLGGSFERGRAGAEMTAVATKSIGDALGNLGSVGSSAADAIEGIFQKMIDGATAAVEALWDMISTTASKANLWSDIAGYWGTDPQRIQQYARAVGASANSFEDLQSAVSKIVMGGKGQTITELLGISDFNYKSDWEYAMAVMDQMAIMTREGRDMTPIYEQIFGEKKGTKVMDLVNDWELIQSMLQQFNGDESGYGMTSEGLEMMNQLSVQIAEIEHKWEAIKDRIAEGFGTVTMDLLVSAEGALDGIADYLNAKDDAGREAALQKIQTNLEDFFRKLGNVLRHCIEILREVGTSLKGSDDPLVSAIGDIMVKLADALQWMVDNADKVKIALETIFGAWLVAQLSAVAGKLASVLFQIGAIKAFKAGGVASGAAAATGAATAAGTASQAAGGGFFATVAGLMTAYGIVKGFDWAQDRRNNHREDVLGTDENLAASVEGNDRLRKNFAAWIEVQNKLNNLGFDATEEEVTALQERSDQLDARLRQMEGYDELWDRYQAWRQEQSGSSMDWNMPEWMREGLENSDWDWGDIIPEPEAPKSLGGTDSEKRDAAEAFWDALRENGADAWWGSEEEALVQQFAEDQEGMNRLIDAITELTASENWQSRENLPDWIWTDAAPWQQGGGDADGITSADLQSFRGLPGQLTAAARNGVSQGVSGLKVTLDGAAVGRMVAPYVSEYIAQDIV